MATGVVAGDGQRHALGSQRSAFLQKSEASLMVEKDLTEWRVLILKTDAKEPIFCIIQVIEQMNGSAQNRPAIQR